MRVAPKKDTSSSTRPDQGASSPTPSRSSERKAPPAQARPDKKKAAPDAKATQVSGSSPSSAAGVGHSINLDKEHTARSSSADATSTDERLDQSTEGSSSTGRPSIAVASATNDDVWGKKAIDLLGVAPDAKAFARLAAAQSFVPPIAVGIFGRWGAGKSFFMRLIYEHIDQLRKGEAPESDSKVFHTKIVQIRFNAWHYVETNLWASLVDHLFTQLANYVDGSVETQEASLLDKVGTARTLTIEAAEELVAKRQEHERAQKALLFAEKNLTKAQQALRSDPELFLDALSEVLNNDGAVQASKKKVADAAKFLGLTDLGNQAEKAAEGWKDLEKELNRGALLGRALFERLGRRWVVVSLVLLLAPVLTVWVLTAIEGGTSSYLQDFPLYVAALSSVLASGTALLGKATSAVQQAIGQLQTGKDAIDKAVDKKLLVLKRNLVCEQNVVNDAKARVDEAQAVFQLAREHLAQATEEFHGSTGAARLIRFIRARASDGHYAAHLGLVASVRRDLEELSRGMTPTTSPASAAPDQERLALVARITLMVDSMGLTPEEGESLHRQLAPAVLARPPFERLVLYIDDLDRCPPDKVVEVLQAVHMLLAFRLFVVFVAVDVRWVSHALMKHHPGLMSTEEESDDGKAGPADYLEKIFQVPYWVREVEPDGGQNLLASVLPKFPEADGPGDDPDKVPHITAATLNVSAEERKLLERLVPYVASSPRKVFWFANVYRLIKANDEFAADMGEGGDANLALISQLVLVTMAPHDFELWFGFLKASDSKLSIVQLLKSLNAPASGVEFGNKRFAHVLALGLSDLAHGEITATMDQSLLLGYAELARRYSFVRVW